LPLRCPGPLGFDAPQPAQVLVATGAPGAGLEPATIRLTGSRSAEGSREVTTRLGNEGATEDARALALGLFRAVGAGEMVPDALCAALAEVVLADEKIARARAVLDAPVEHVLRRALELAAAVLAPVSARAADGTAAG